MVVVSVWRAALHSCTITSVQPEAVSAGHMTQRVRWGEGAAREEARAAGKSAKTERE